MHRWARATAIVAAALLLPHTAEAAKQRDAEGVWRLRIERKGWTPPTVTGTLRLARDGKAWTGTVSFNEIAWSGMPVEEIEVGKGRLVATLVHPELNVRLDAKLKGDTLAGTSVWSGEHTHPFTGERADSALLDARLRDRALPPVKDPAEVGLDHGALETLVVLAQEADTDQLVVLKDGRTVVSRTFGQRGPIHTMSVTKAVTSLAVPLLVADGKADGPDDLVAKWVPDWKDGLRGRVTLRDLLCHTSGLKHNRMAGELNGQDDRVAFALASKVVREPGTHFAYNNRAYAALGGVLEAAAGEPVDEYLGQRLFDSIGARERRWSRDRAGHPITYAELQLTARDLAAVGHVVASDGLWGKERLLPAGWTETAMQPGCDATPFWGLGWALRLDLDNETVVQTEDTLAEFGKAGFTSAAQLAPLTGKAFKGRRAYFTALRKGGYLDRESGALFDRILNQGAQPFETDARVIGIYHTGDRGQWLAVYPEHRLVAVRLRVGAGTANSRQTGFGRFLSLVEAALR